MTPIGGSQLRFSFSEGYLNIFDALLGNPSTNLSTTIPLSTNKFSFRQSPLSNFFQQVENARHNFQISKKFLNFSKRAERLEAWCGILEKLPSGALSSPKLIDQYTEIFREWLDLSSDHRRLGKNSGLGKINFRQKLETLTIHLLKNFSYLKHPSAEPAIQHLLLRIIDQNDIHLFSFLSAKGLERYVDKTVKAQKLLEGAKKISSVEDRRSELLKSLLVFAELRLTGKVVEMISTFRSTYPINFSVIEKLECYSALSITLNGSGLDQETEIQKEFQKTAQEVRKYQDQKLFFLHYGDSKTNQPRPTDTMERIEILSSVLRGDQLLLAEAFQQAAQKGGKRKELLDTLTSRAQLLRKELEQADGIPEEYRLQKLAQLTQVETIYNRLNQVEDFSSLSTSNLTEPQRRASLSFQMVYAGLINWVQDYTRKCGCEKKGKELEEAVLKNFQEAQRLYLSGKVASLEEAFQLTFKYPKSEKGNLQDFFFKDPIGKIPVGQKFWQFLRNADRSEVSFAEFSRAALVLAQSFFETEQYLAAGQIAKLLENIPEVSASAKKLTKKIPSDLWVAIRRELRNGSIIFAESKEEVLKSSAMLLVGFGVGKVFGIAAKSAWVARGFQGGRITQLAANSPFLFKAGKVGAHWAVEGFGFTASNMGMKTLLTGKTDHLNGVHFLKEWASMILTFGILHGIGGAITGLGRRLESVPWFAAKETEKLILENAGKLKLHLGARFGLGMIHWLGRIHGFTLSEYLSEALPLKDKKNNPFLLRLVQSAVTDGHMILAHKGVNALSGGRLNRWDQNVEKQAMLVPALAKIWIEGKGESQEISPTWAYSQGPRQLKESQLGFVNTLLKAGDFIPEAHLEKLFETLDECIDDFNTRAVSFGKVGADHRIRDTHHFEKIYQKIAESSADLYWQAKSLTLLAENPHADLSALVSKIVGLREKGLNEAAILSALDFIVMIQPDFASSDLFKKTLEEVGAKSPVYAKYIQSSHGQDNLKLPQVIDPNPQLTRYHQLLKKYQQSHILELVDILDEVREIADSQEKIDFSEIIEQARGIARSVKEQRTTNLPFSEHQSKMMESLKNEYPFSVIIAEKIIAEELEGSQFASSSIVEKLQDPKIANGLMRLEFYRSMLERRDLLAEQNFAALLGNISHVADKIKGLGLEEGIGLALHTLVSYQMFSGEQNLRSVIQMLPHTFKADRTPTSSTYEILDKLLNHYQFYSYDHLELLLEVIDQAIKDPLLKATTFANVGRHPTRQIRLDDIKTILSWIGNSGADPSDIAALATELRKELNETNPDPFGTSWVDETFNAIEKIGEEVIEGSSRFVRVSDYTPLETLSELAKTEADPLSSLIEVANQGKPRAFEWLYEVIKFRIKQDPEHQDLLAVFFYLESQAFQPNKVGDLALETLFRVALEYPPAVDYLFRLYQMCFGELPPKQGEDFDRSDRGLLFFLSERIQESRQLRAGLSGTLDLSLPSISGSKGKILASFTLAGGGLLLSEGVANAAETAVKIFSGSSEMLAPLGILAAGALALFGMVSGNPFRNIPQHLTKGVEDPLSVAKVLPGIPDQSRPNNTFMFALGKLLSGLKVRDPQELIDFLLRSEADPNILSDFGQKADSHAIVGALVSLSANSNLSTVQPIIIAIQKSQASAYYKAWGLGKVGRHPSVQDRWALAQAILALGADATKTVEALGDLAREAQPHELEKIYEQIRKLPARDDVKLVAYKNIGLNKHVTSLRILLRQMGELNVELDYKTLQLAELAAKKGSVDSDLVIETALQIPVDPHYQGIVIGKAGSREEVLDIRPYLQRLQQPHFSAENRMTGLGYLGLNPHPQNQQLVLEAILQSEVAPSIKIRAMKVMASVADATLIPKIFDTIRTSPLSASERLEALTELAKNRRLDLYVETVADAIFNAPLTHENEKGRGLVELLSHPHLEYSDYSRWVDWLSEHHQDGFLRVLGKEHPHRDRYLEKLFSQELESPTSHSRGRNGLFTLFAGGALLPLLENAAWAGPKKIDGSELSWLNSLFSEVSARDLSFYGATLLGLYLGYKILKPHFEKSEAKNEKSKSNDDSAAKTLLPIGIGLALSSPSSAYAYDNLKLEPMVASLRNYWAGAQQVFHDVVSKISELPGGKWLALGGLTLLGITGTLSVKAVRKRSRKSKLVKLNEKEERIQIPLPQYDENTIPRSLAAWTASTRQSREDDAARSPIKITLGEEQKSSEASEIPEYLKMEIIEPREEVSPEGERTRDELEPSPYEEMEMTTHDPEVVAKNFDKRFHLYFTIRSHLQKIATLNRVLIVNSLQQILVPLTRLVKDLDRLRPYLVEDPNRLQMAQGMLSEILTELEKFESVEVPSKMDVVEKTRQVLKDYSEPVCKEGENHQEAIPIPGDPGTKALLSIGAGLGVSLPEIVHAMVSGNFVGDFSNPIAWLAAGSFLLAGTTVLLRARNPYHEPAVVKESPRVTELKSVLESSLWTIQDHIDAAKELGNRNAITAFDLLWAAVKEPRYDMLVRLSAAESLMKIDPDEAFKLLNSIFKDGHQYTSDLRLGVIQLWGKKGEKRAIGRLFKIIDYPPTEENNVIRVHAYKSLDEVLSK